MEGIFSNFQKTCLDNVSKRKILNCLIDSLNEYSILSSQANSIADFILSFFNLASLLYLECSSKENEKFFKLSVCNSE